MSCKHEPIPTGTRFGRLVITSSDISKSNSGDIMYEAICDCGSEPKYYYQGKLRSGHTISCGCFRKEQTAIRNQLRYLKD